MLAATTFSLIIPSHRLSNTLWVLRRLPSNGGKTMETARTVGQEAAISLGYSSQSAALIISLGIIIGAILLWLIRTGLPLSWCANRMRIANPLLLHRHEHFNKGAEGKISENFQRIWLFVLAITLHNFPEGLAIGVGFGDGNIANGKPIAIAIG